MSPATRRAGRPPRTRATCPPRSLFDRFVVVVVIVVVVVVVFVVVVFVVGGGGVVVVVVVVVVAMFVLLLLLLWWLLLQLLLFVVCCVCCLLVVVCCMLVVGCWSLVVVGVVVAVVIVIVAVGCYCCCCCWCCCCCCCCCCVGCVCLCCWFRFVDVIGVVVVVVVVVVAVCCCCRCCLCLCLCCCGRGRGICYLCYVVTCPPLSLPGRRLSPRDARIDGFPTLIRGSQMMSCVKVLLEVGVNKSEQLRMNLSGSRVRAHMTPHFMYPSADSCEYATHASCKSFRCTHTQYYTLVASCYLLRACASPLVLART